MVGRAYVLVTKMLNTFNKADGCKVYLISLKQFSDLFDDVSLTYSYVMGSIGFIQL